MCTQGWRRRKVLIPARESHQKAADSGRFDVQEYTTRQQLIVQLQCGEKCVCQGAHRGREATTSCWLQVLAKNAAQHMTAVHCHGAFPAQRCAERLSARHCGTGGTSK